VKADNPENGAQWLGNGALREAAFGNPAEAAQGAEAGLTLAPESPGVAFEAALAFAMAGDTARAESLAEDLNRRFPLDTQTQSLWLPTIRAQSALNRSNPAEALDDLQVAIPPVEFGNMAFTSISCLYPTYIRGQAYLAAGQGNAAAAEFQKILTHNGLVWNCWSGALAHLGMARANALEARGSQSADVGAARAKALASYKAFFDLWKDADPSIPILKQAKSEYAQLQ
jgi:tetratricopeptide (TPR) repeat protein